jgi:hypothetical protein
MWRWVRNGRAMPAASSHTEPVEPSSPTEPAARLRLTSPAEILAAVPFLLGFFPEQSLVVIGLRGKEVGLTMRVDVGAALNLREAIVQRLLAQGTSSAVLILFDPPPDDRRRPGRSLMRAVRRAFDVKGIHVKDALGVREGRYWSYLCTDTTCCPGEGRAVPVAGSTDHSKVAASFVAVGTAPLANRPALEASILPNTGTRRVDLDAAYLLALEQPATHPSLRWMEAVRRYASGDGRRPHRALSSVEAAQLIVGLRDVLVRDEVLSWTAAASNTGVLAVLRELAPLALPPFETDVLAALAWAAYAFGDGALASVALERALRAEPDHSLAVMLATALDGGVSPTHLHEISRSFRGVHSMSLDAPPGD